MIRCYTCYSRDVISVCVGEFKLEYGFGQSQQHGLNQPSQGPSIIRPSPHLQCPAPTLLSVCTGCVPELAPSTWRSFMGASGWHCHGETARDRAVFPWTSTKLVTGSSHLCLPKNTQAMLGGWWPWLCTALGTICLAKALLLVVRIEKETFNDTKPNWVAQQAAGMQRLQVLQFVNWFNAEIIRCVIGVSLDEIL